MNLKLVEIKQRERIEKVELTASQKFNLLKREVELRTKQPLKKFHFQLVEHDSKLVLFNGIGNQLLEVENSVTGEREARTFAFKIFDYLDNQNRNGGYKFDGPFSKRMG